MANPFKIGDVVRLKSEHADGDTSTASVVITLDEDKIEGGLRLDKLLNGWQYWNAQDVELVERAPAKEG